MIQSRAPERSSAPLLWEGARLRPRPDAIRALAATIEDPAAVVDAAIDHGIGALLWRALVAGGCESALGPEGGGLSRYAALRRHEALLLLPRALAAALGPLLEAGLEPLVFKGPAVASHYPAPGLRSMGDIDILLPPTDHHRAVALLTAAGWKVMRHAGRAHHETALVHDDVPGLPLELHRDLSVWYERNTGLRAADLWHQRVPLQGLGTPAFGLPPEAEMVALAAHAGKPYHCYQRLIWSVDLVAVADDSAATGTPLDWDRVDELARRWRCRTVVAVAVAQARRLGLDAPAWLTRIGGSAVRRAALAPLLGPDWPAEARRGDHRNRLPYALADGGPRRAALFVGSPAPQPLVRWPWVYLQEAGYALRRAWRTRRGPGGTPPGDG